LERIPWFPYRGIIPYPNNEFLRGFPTLLCGRNYLSIEPIYQAEFPDLRQFHSGIITYWLNSKSQVLNSKLIQVSNVQTIPKSKIYPLIKIPPALIEIEATRLYIKKRAGAPPRAPALTSVYFILKSLLFCTLPL
jgi:hypothetical protein